MELSVSSIRKAIFVSLISLSLSLFLPYQLTAGVLVFLFLSSSFKHPDLTEITPSHSYRCRQTLNPFALLPSAVISVQITRPLLDPVGPPALPIQCAGCTLQLCFSPPPPIWQNHDGVYLPIICPFSCCAHWNESVSVTQNEVSSDWLVPLHGKIWDFSFSHLVPPHVQYPNISDPL